MYNNEIRDELLSLDTACMCDTNEEIRVIDCAIKPVNKAKKFVGIARTVSSQGDILPVIKGLKEAQPGEVLVVDTDGCKRAVAGELFTTEVKRKGLEALIIDGACRDLELLQNIDLPVYSRYTNPMKSKMEKVHATQIAITCGGVKVYPGDIVFGDKDGIIVLAKEEVLSALKKAKEIQKKEADLLKRMQGGESMIDIILNETNLTEELTSLKKAIK